MLNENNSIDDKIPSYTSKLRQEIIKMPKSCYRASGIVINGRRIKTLIFTTDIAIIRNCDADAVFAVYPFTPQPAISQSLISASYIPVFCGCGGEITRGLRSVSVAKDAEAQGAMGIVLNAQISDINISVVAKSVDIPVVITVVDEKTNIQSRLDAGAGIINVASGVNTANMVKKIRKDFPQIPIIASGGPSEETIQKTIEAGANAITYTPPTAQILFREQMRSYREELGI